ncbi:ABC transporter permease [Halocella sp. SP3-1]|uniref:ABC transporter permease n=1 Tax=Halocella sp. SP3-1 TaxID=2382161 RepID=UPI000F756C00|nr:ABC transporter permease [Halocella sp. SP3-1]AZO94749.1 ABC transporter permease [Halocella sp. SP3-1]
MELKRHSNLTKIKELLHFKESGILLALIIMSALLSITTPNFLNQYNLGIVVRQASFVALVALGQTLVLITGGIDLSVGSIAGLSSILGAILMTSTPLNPYLCTLLAVLCGMFFGIINGVFIAKIGLNPFIVTLATGEAFAGLILVITKGYPVLGIPTSFKYLGQGMIGPVPVPVVILLIISLILIYILKNTPFGRYIYSIGGNESASKLVGIKVDKIKISVYAIAGALAALAGIIFVSRANAGQATIGASWLMPSVTAAIIGGTSLSGGEGTILGTLIGAILMGVLSNGIVLLNVSSYLERVIIGLVVLVAVIIDLVRKRNRS